MADESPTTAPIQTARQAMLGVHIKDKMSLYGSYMPFIKNGGLFIPIKTSQNAQSNLSYQLGDEVFVRIKLLEETDLFGVACKVIWITPRGAQGNHGAGIGVQFGEQDKGMIRGKIETHLAGVKSDRSTETM